MRLWRTYSYVFGKEMDVFTPVEALEHSTRLRIPNSLGIYASFVPKNLKLEVLNVEPSVWMIIGFAAAH